MSGRTVPGELPTLERSYPEAAAIRPIHGVGPLTTLAFVLIIEDLHRFKKSRQIGAFLGLCPRRHQFGSSDPQMHISKMGDREPRRLLVNAANYILGPFGRDSELRSWGQAMAARGGDNAKRRAVVGVARTLAVIVHQLWLTGECSRRHRPKSADAA